MARPIRNLLGKKFGRLTVIAFSHLGRQAYWKCQCDCGNIVTVRGSHLTAGDTVSCNCAMRTSKYGGADHVLYGRWQHMRDRCLRPSSEDWHNYGGRGITICERWDIFDNFVEDMYPSFIEGLTLERINNDKGYYKENCKWATRKEQVNNQRSYHDCLFRKLDLLIGG